MYSTTTTHGRHAACLPTARTGQGSLSAENENDLWIYRERPHCVDGVLQAHRRSSRVARGELLSSALPATYMEDIPVSNGEYSPGQVQ